MTTVERNNQKRRIINFLRHLFARFKTKFHNSEQERCKKQSVNIRDEFHFSEVHGSMHATGPVQS